MSVDQPTHVLAALGRRRFLLSAWPWRSLLFVFTALPVIGFAAVMLSPFSFSWTGALANAVHGKFPTYAIVFVLVFATILVMTAGPLLAMPVAALERQRLAIVDPRPVVSGHRVPRAGLVSWLTTRYSEAATWRELLYTLLLATLAPIAYGALLLAAFAVAVMIFSPLLTLKNGDGIGGIGGEITIGLGEITTPRDAVPYVLLGLVLIPVLAYLTGFLAAGHTAVARTLIGSGGDVELREVARSRTRLVDAFDAERRRIERDLHDGAQHRLTSLTLQLGVARLDLPDDSPVAVALDKAHNEAKDLMVMLRDLVQGISPQILADLGLAAALRDLATRSPLDVSVSVAEGLADRYPARVENTAYFVACEAIGNVAKHAGVTSAEIALTQFDDTLVLEVRDSGSGGADPAGGSGLTGLADRVAAVNGRLLLSSPAGGPTLVRVELPCIP
jgi:signal transduction histidine kinase